MTKEMLEKEFEIRELKKANAKLQMELKTTKKQLEAKVIKEVEQKVKPLEKEVKKLRKQKAIADDLEQRLEKRLEMQELESEKIINEKDAEIYALKKKIIEQAKELDITKNERDKYLASLNLDGMTCGIPTSITPINKKKIIPNTREKSGKVKGGQIGHKKHKLEKFKDEEINEKEEIKIEECPNCHSKELKELNTNNKEKILF